MLGKLLDTSPAAAWHLRQWPLFHETQATRDVAILPAAALTAFQPDLPYDATEVVGLGLLRKALDSWSSPQPFAVMPPWRFSPRQHDANQLLSLDPDEGLAALGELMTGVKLAGFQKVVFFVASPDLSSWMDVAGREIRISHQLQPFLIHLADLGWDPREAGEGTAFRKAYTALSEGEDPGDVSLLRQALEEILDRPLLPDGGKLNLPQPR